MTQRNLCTSIEGNTTHLHVDFYVQIAKVALCRLAFAIFQCCVVWRSLADWSETGKGNRRIGRRATAGGLDKRPQCAARSGCCFDWRISAIRQCALPERNVRVRYKPRRRQRFLNIHGIGHGA